MAQIGRPPLVAQPQYPAPIDWNNPLSRGLVFSFDAALGSPRNQVGGKLGEAFGTGVAQAHGRYGREITFSGSQGNRSCSFGNTFGKLDNATQATWEFLVKFNEVAAAPHFFGDWDFNQNWLVQRNGTGLIWVAADDASTNRRRWDASSLFSAAGYYHVILSWQGGANFTAWVNGVDKSASFSVVSNAATQMGTTGAIDYIQFGTVNGGTALNGSMVFARIWNRGLSANECRVLSENPWQIFQRQSQIFVNSAAGGETIVSPGAGHVVVVGKQPTISQPISLPIGNGAIRVAGKTPSLSQPMNLSPIKGPVVFAGYQASITQAGSGTAVSPGKGAVLVSGAAPTIEQAISVVPGFGHLSIVGKQPTINRQEAVSQQRGGDDVPERYEIWEPRKKPKNRDEELDKVVRKAFQKATGTTPEPVVVQAATREIMPRFDAQELAGTQQAIINRILEIQAEMDDEEAILLLL